MSIAYQLGAKAFYSNDEVCPFDEVEQFEERSRWMAGWNDAAYGYE